MIFGSVCSGIEAASVAWGFPGWRAAFLAETAAFPRAVLRHHYPDVPLHGDFTTIARGEYGPIDVLVGGTPCQDFSVAGLRAGIAGERGNLTLEFLRLAGRLRPEWVVWENVPGVLSLDGGRAFGAVLGGLAQLGYGFAYRVLDAQYFGLAQRRSRVFVVGHLGDWRRAAAVLFERESLSGDPAPRRPTRQDLAPTLGSRPTGGGGNGTDFDLDGGLIAGCLAARDSKGADSDTKPGHLIVAHALRADGFDASADGFDASEDGTGRGVPLVADPVSASEGRTYTHEGRNNFRLHNVVSAFAENVRGEVRTAAVATALSGGGGKPGQGYPAVMSAMAVRRLTPLECERLQGFPDGYTLVEYRGKPAADGPRYKALGNSMAVPVMRWIGERIQLVADL